jgi:hypothetical protein
MAQPALGMFDHNHKSRVYTDAYSKAGGGARHQPLFLRSIMSFLLALGVALALAATSRVRDNQRQTV